MKNFFIVFALTLISAIPGLAQKTAKNTSAGIDKGYLQKIWDGWAALDPAKQKQFYAPGQHTFFDITPLKYNSWDEYQSGVKMVFADVSAAKFTVNDDVQIHKAGPDQWITSTVSYDMTHKSGKHDMGQMRWTAVFEKEGGKWLVVHEHVSMPLQ